jgi:hypothetical protein
VENVPFNIIIKKFELDREEGEFFFQEQISFERIP